MREEGPAAPGNRVAWALKVALPLVLFLVVLLLPAPAGLTPQGQRVLAVVALVVALWSTEVLPLAITGLLAVILLVLFKGVPGLGDALYGFSSPVPYFLIGVLTLGLGVFRSGLAERAARFLIARSGGSPVSLFSQMLLAFVLLTFLLPSATTRNAIMVHIYDQVLEIWRVPRRSPLAKAIMMGLGSLNRLASTALLTGGITPIMAAALIGGFSWTGWFVLMAVPYYALLAVGGLLLALLYRGAFRGFYPSAQAAPKGGLAGKEVKAALIAGITSLLWLTDSLHHLHPAIPALIAAVLILTPRVGLLDWHQFEREVGWANFFVLATSLSIAQAMIASGVAGWFAQWMLKGVSTLAATPLLALLALMLAATVVRLFIPSIGGYLALVIPVAVSMAGELGINPLVAGLAVTLAGDGVLYYSAQSPSSIVIFVRGHLTGPEIFRFGLLMTVVVYIVVLAVAVPYWGAVGAPLVR